jgi:hypothetical protein
LLKTLISKHLYCLIPTIQKIFFPTRKGTDPIPSLVEKFKIVGASTTPLPANTVENRRYQVLLYVIFEVLVDKENPNLPVNTPIYINADVIKYNGINIREHVFTVNNFPCTPTSLASQTAKEQLQTNCLLLV